MNKIKKLLNNTLIINIIIMIGIFTSFFILDLALRYLSDHYNGFCRWFSIAPNAFTLSWIIIIIGILYLLPKKIRIITYPILVILANIITLAEYLHFKILDRFFSFSDLFLVGQGKDYFLYAISQTNYKILLILLLSIASTIITVIIMKKSLDFNRNRRYYLLTIIIAVVLTIGARGIAFYKLGEQVPSTDWAAAITRKNVYLDCNNPNKGISVSGIYEFMFRNTYLFIKNNYFANRKETINEIDKILENKSNEITPNDYTGIFEGKNVIYILLESIDSWLLTEEIMPTLYKLKNEGLNFTNRYAPSFGGGQTINSEFASNSGLYAINNAKAIYNYDSNNFTYSLPNILKQNGYSSVSVHYNEGDFYNRALFHRALGFDKHYSLEDNKTINHIDYNYSKDSDLIKNEEVYNMIVRDEPFYTFITTFSAHLPYDNTNGLCANNPYNLDVNNNKELSCIRNLARETDEMIRLLIEKLERDNLLENTVLVLATDHYTYGYSDQNHIKDFKRVNNNHLLQHVPLIIWNKNLNPQNIDTLIDTADIVPTLLNMLGINYNPNYYIGTDVFSKNHENFVYFGKDVFYDGNIYYDGNETTVINDNIKEILSIVANKMTLNDKFITSNYFDNK